MERRQFPRFHTRAGVTARILDFDNGGPHGGDLVDVSRTGAYLSVPTIPAGGTYQLEFSDTSSADKSVPLVRRLCEILPNRSNPAGKGVALLFKRSLSESELGELISPPSTHEPIDLAKSDRETVNGELGVIRTCRSQIFLAALTAIGTWLIGAVGLGLTNHLNEPTWIALGASFPYVVLSISILCLIEKANSISNRKAFLAALEDYLRRDQSPPNYLGWNHLSINHESCRARAKNGFCIQDDNGRNCCCWDGIGKQPSSNYSVMPLNGALDRFGTLATLVITPLYFASSALLYWYCTYSLFGSQNGVHVALGVVISLIALFLIYNVWSMAKGKRSIGVRYTRWSYALQYCRTINGKRAQFQPRLPLN